jgi:hypothetical protein
MRSRRGYNLGIENRHVVGGSVPPDASLESRTKPFIGNRRNLLERVGERRGGNKMGRVAVCGDDEHRLSPPVAQALEKPKRSRGASRAKPYPAPVWNRPGSRILWACPATLLVRSARPT